MRKNYVYLLFALFFAFSACQEEDVQSTVEEAEKVEPTTFTFIYKGKKYLETRSNATDQLQNKIIENVLSTETYAVYLDPDLENTFLLFDTSKDAKIFFGNSEMNAKTSSDCLPSVNTAALVLYRDDNYSGTRDYVLPYTLSPRWYRYNIDNNPNTSKVDYVQVPNLSSVDFNDKTSSIIFRNYFSGGFDECRKDAIAYLYQHESYAGRSFILRVESKKSVKIPKLSEYYFYDFFGIRYGSTWNNKFSSLELFFSN